MKPDPINAIPVLAHVYITLYHTDTRYNYEILVVNTQFTT